MSGPFYSTPLECYQGVDFDSKYVFFLPPANASTDVQNLVPLDFTGATCRLNVRLQEDPASTSILTLTSTPAAGLSFISDTFSPGPPLPTVPNGVRIQITRAQSLAMNASMAVRGASYDLLVDMPGGTTLLLMSGTFDLLPTVTR